jgi:hypothetical protein
VYSFVPAVPTAGWVLADEQRVAAIIARGVEAQPVAVLPADAEPNSGLDLMSLWNTVKVVLVSKASVQMLPTSGLACPT